MSSRASEDSPGHRGGHFAEYANTFRIGHNPSELVIEFGQTYSGDAQPAVLFRVVLTPRRARELATMLRASVDAQEVELAGLAREVDTGEPSAPVGRGNAS